MRHSYKDVAIKAAIKSGLFIKRSVGKIKTITYKGRINIVTDVDVEAERIIMKIIRDAFPDHSILSEESKPISLVSSPYKWIIDPLDGTTNFAHAFPFFAVSIGLEKDGRMILGAVYDPSRDELFFAEKGKGAYLNKKRIAVSKASKLGMSFLATGFSYGIKEAGDDNIRNFKNFLMRSIGVRRAGSAALDICYVACGRFDGFWELDLHPWDTAAGALILREAKGIVTRFDGFPYTPYDRDILATNGRLHSQMLKILKC